MLPHDNISATFESRKCHLSKQFGNDYLGNGKVFDFLVFGTSKFCVFMPANFRHLQMKITVGMCQIVASLDIRSVIIYKKYSQKDMVPFPLPKKEP